MDRLIQQSSLYAKTMQPSSSVRVNVTVYDTDGKTTLPGVNIFVSGTNAGGITDGNGKVSFIAEVNSDVSFEFIGYKTQIFKTTAIPAKVVMQESSEDLADVDIKNTYKFPWFKLVLGTSLAIGVIMYAANSQKHIKTKV